MALVKWDRPVQVLVRARAAVWSASDATWPVARPAANGRHGFHPRHISLQIGAALTLLLILAAILGPLLAPYAPDKVLAGPRLTAPSGAYPLGTDALGRDLLSRVLWGAPLALGMALCGTAVAAGLGIIPGLIGGYWGGRLDHVLTRLMDVGLAFPGTLLALVIVARMGPSLTNAVIALGIAGAPGFYRVTRGLTLCARRAMFVEAALSVGVSPLRIVFRHVLPNVATSLVVLATSRAGVLLLAGGALSFLGLGAQPPSPEWGAMLAGGRAHLETAPWLALYPGIAITASVVGFSLLGDGLRDLLDGR